MDSGEPPKPPPAIVAPAKTTRIPRSYVSAQAGIGIGSGSSGAAGSYFALADAWPLPFAGVGFELSRGGMIVDDDSANDSLEAVRVRLSFRLRHGRHGTFTASGSVGTGWSARNYTEACSPKEEVDWGCVNGNDGNQEPFTSGPRLSLGGELGTHWRRSRALLLGFFLRVDTVGPMRTVTLGPKIGFEL